MRYKVVYMPKPEPYKPEWFNSEKEAWDYILNMKCGFETGESCEVCQAEWDVFSEDELNDIKQSNLEEKG